MFLTTCTEKNQPILSLATSTPGFSIAAGTELQSSQAAVAIWSADTVPGSVCIAEYFKGHTIYGGSKTAVCGEPQR